MRSLAIVLLLASCGRLQIEDDVAYVPDAYVPPEAVDPCLACSPDQICVTDYANGCPGFAGTKCVTRTIEDACTPSTSQCSEACQEAYCSQPYQCMYRDSCTSASPLAFTCFGP
jgi:hypothetical protein